MERVAHSARQLIREAKSQGENLQSWFDQYTAASGLLAHQESYAEGVDLLDEVIPNLRTRPEISRLFLVHGYTAPEIMYGQMRILRQHEQTVTAALQALAPLHPFFLDLEPNRVDMGTRVLTETMLSLLTRYGRIHDYAGDLYKTAIYFGTSRDKLTWAMKTT